MQLWVVKLQQPSLSCRVGGALQDPQCVPEIVDGTDCGRYTVFFLALHPCDKVEFIN